MNVDPNGTWTISFGVNANVTLILGISFSWGYSFDDKGNIARQFSYGVNGGVADFGLGSYFGGTNADTVSNLNGPSFNAGATGGSGLYGGMDLIAFDDGDDEFDGGQILVGAGSGVDIHGGINQTVTVWQTSWREIGGWFEEKWEWISGLFN